MTLELPGDIPIAVRQSNYLLRIGNIHQLPGLQKSEAVVVVTGDPSDPVSVWASPLLKSYREIWNLASSEKWVDKIQEWGEGVDIDHVYPKSWAAVPLMELSHVRLFPVWQEINRSAGAGREKSTLFQLRRDPRPVGNIVYASELQVLKILGHPVGTYSEPVSIFSGKKSKR